MRIITWIVHFTQSGVAVAARFTVFDDLQVLGTTPNDAFKTRLAVYKFEGDALAWWKAYKQAKEETVWRFLRLAGFLGQAAGTAEEQAKNFCWGLHKSILDHVMCIQFTDVAQVADAARKP
ncbi:hypothetical protein Tco_0392754 [Tanacetum coccineum]